MALYVKNRRKKMKIKELLESLSEVKRFISKIMVDGYHFKSFDDFPGVSGLKNDLEVESWKVSVVDYTVVLIIHTEGIKGTEEPENEDSVEEDELTVGDVLSSICFDDENTIAIFDKNNIKVYYSDEDDVFALCELLCLDVGEYAQIHRGKHQTIEIHLKSY